MIAKTVYVGSAAKLTSKGQQLVVEAEYKSKSIPVEDIGMVVLDHYQTTFTQKAVLDLIGQNAAILWCDEKHMPVGLVLPMAGHHVFTEKLRHQLDATLPLKKQLWKQTIQAKLANQAAILRSINSKKSQLIQGLITRVRSGDPENIEGIAAAAYWKALFPHLEGFVRHQHGEQPNAILNYGYAILRSMVARALVGSGMLPAVGIFHRNKYNAFCLADDIMEPYRPYVDLIVLRLMQEYEDDLPETLTKELKTALLQIATMDVRLNGQLSPMMVAIQRTTASLMQCFEGSTRKLVYPVL